MKKHYLEPEALRKLLAAGKALRDKGFTYAVVCQELLREGFKDRDGMAYDPSWMNWQLVLAYPELRKRYKTIRVTAHLKAHVSKSIRERAVDLILRAEDFSTTERVELAMELLTKPEVRR